MSTLPPEQHPPKPRLTLRVGITGHRPNKLAGEDVPRVSGQLREVMGAIDRVVAAIHQANAAVYSNAPQTDLPATKELYRIRLISGFAEGVDQIAVAAAPATWTVEAMLPFPKDEYRKDFVKSAAGDERDVTGDLDSSLERAQVITELPMPTKPERRNHGYVMAGGYLLRQVDILVAVWDGEEPKPGGTGAIVEEAHDSGIPVVWISTADKTVQFLGGFDDETPKPSDKPWGDDTLRTILDPILAAPSAARPGRRRSPRQGLEGFYAETWKPVCHSRLYDRLKQFTNGKRPRPELRAPNWDSAMSEFSQFIDEGPPVDGFRRRLKDVLADRYVWADTIAVHYSHYYRSAYVLAYLLAALAVFIALFGIFVPGQQIHLKGILVVLELIVIYKIVRIVKIGRDGHWHERWLEYRTVAESLRHGRFLAYVSEFGHSHQSSATVQPWTIWYVRATLREIGLPNAVLDQDYQRPLLQATLDYEVQGQLGYHRGNAEAMYKLDHFLHRWGTRCFTATPWFLFFFLIAYLAYLLFSIPAMEDLFKQMMPSSINVPEVVHSIMDVGKLLVVVAAAGLPAVGAALAGIRVQGDFEGSKERSQRMVKELTILKDALEAAIRSQPRLERTADMLIEVARVLSEDLAAWQELYGRKRINLPA